MKIGFCLPHDGELSRPENITLLAQRAEKLGFSSLIEPSDHNIMPNRIATTYPYSSSGEYTDTTSDLDQSITLSFLAAKTSTIRLMTGIIVVPYRNPIILANTLATLDYLSNGRLDIGAGVGWMKEEFGFLKIPYERRGEIMDENLKILKTIWSKEVPAFQGKYYQFNGAHFSPEVVQKPHPPIWIGGESPQAIRRAARLGDGWIPIDVNSKFPLNTLDRIEHSISKLRKEILAVGRKPEDVKIGFLPQDFALNDGEKSDTLFVGDADAILQSIREVEKLGINFLGLNFLQTDLESTISYSERFVDLVISKL